MTEGAALLPDWETFERDYVAQGIPHLFVVRPVPAVTLFVDQDAIRIGARFEQAAVRPKHGQVALAEVHVGHVTQGSAHCLEIWTETRHLFPNFYRLAADIVNAVVEEGVAPSTALAGAVAQWEALLSRPSLMSDESQIGLFGELWVLRRLIATQGTAAVNAWVGPAGEAHDFRFGQVELEVKTTSGSTRIHVISGLGQLQPSTGCALYILSLKIANAGSGGKSLPEEIEDIQSSLTADPLLIKRFRNALAHIGYRDDTKHLYLRRYRLRDAPMLIPVVDDVPRLTSEAFSGIEERFAPDRISRVNYSINVEGLGFADGTKPFHELIPSAPASPDSENV